MEYKGTFTITSKEVGRFTRRVEWARRQRGIWVFTAVGLLAGNFVLRMLWRGHVPRFWAQVLASLIGGGFVLGLCLGMLCYSVAKASNAAYVSGRRWTYRQTLTINGLGVTCETEDASSHADFGEFTVEERPEAFYFFTAPETAWILPKAQMEHPEKDTALVRKICTAMAQPEHRHLQRDKKS